MLYLVPEDVRSHMIVEVEEVEEEKEMRGCGECDGQ